jgi:3-hydroxymyristoyl/3-hydroxydecanoyl-(acyl carrier protein) dehydratase
MKYPSIEKIANDKEKHELQVTFTANPDLDWFQGHFENNPILPGIATVAFLIEFLKINADLDLNKHEYTINQIKYSKPVMPNMRCEMKISINDKEIKFTLFQLQEPLTPAVCSTGKLNYE